MIPVHDPITPHPDPTRAFIPLGGVYASWNVSRSRRVGLVDGTSVMVQEIGWGCFDTHTFLLGYRIYAGLTGKTRFALGILRAAG